MVPRFVAVRWTLRMTLVLLLRQDRLHMLGTVCARRMPLEIPTVAEDAQDHDDDDGCVLAILAGLV